MTRAKKLKADKPKRSQLTRPDAPLTREEYKQLLSDPEAFRLVSLFRVAEHLSEDIEAYWRDHPERCACLVCRSLRANKAARPTCSDYLIAIHAVICSATATHDELPYFPEAEPRV